MYSWIECAADSVVGGERTRRNLPSTLTSRSNNNGIVVGGSPAVRKSLRVRMHDMVRISVGLALVTVGVGCIAITLGAHGADNSDGIGALSTFDPVTTLPPVRVQPRAWEFRAPGRGSDLSPESARAVDQLYEQLMRGTLRCGRTVEHTPTGGRC
jgi:hypothetical protein